VRFTIALTKDISDGPRPEGTSVHVLEPDDGSGWVKVADPDGRDGLVPASYLEYDDATSEKPTSPNPHSHQGSGKYGKSHCI
jgi:hypothetical protein